MILFQFNNMLLHKKVYQYTNTVFEDYVADTVSFFTLPSKLPFSVTQNLTHRASQEVD